LSQIYYAAVADPEWFAAIYTCYDTDALPADEIASMKAEMTEMEFRQEMLCDFTASNANTLISIEDAMTASKRRLEPRLYEFAPKILGVDVAWEGGDRCVILPRQRLQRYEPIVVPALPEKSFVMQAANKIVEWKPDMTFVHTTGGYGAEVVSRLTDARH